VADKWRTCELRLILLSDVFGDMFIEEIGEKLNEAQESLQQVKNDKETDNILKSLEEFNGLLTDKSKPEKHQVALTSKVHFAFLHTSLQRNVSLLISAVTEWALLTPMQDTNCSQESLRHRSGLVHSPNLCY
jgi:hypothetical protein